MWKLRSILYSFTKMLIRKSECLSPFEHWVTSLNSFHLSDFPYTTIEVHSTHGSRIDWKNGEFIFQSGNFEHAGKSGNVTPNPGKGGILANFFPSDFLIKPYLLYKCLYYLNKILKKKNNKKIIKNKKKLDKNRGNLSVRKSGNHAVLV